MRIGLPSFVMWCVATTLAAVLPGSDVPAPSTHKHRGAGSP
jgi:hypothetical protein